MIFKYMKATTLMNKELPRQTSITNGEYQELMNRVVKQNEILNSIKAQISVCPEAIPCNTLKKLLRE